MMNSCANYLLDFQAATQNSNKPGEGPQLKKLSLATPKLSTPKLTVLPSVADKGMAEEGEYWA